MDANESVRMQFKNLPKGGNLTTLVQYLHNYPSQILRMSRNNFSHSKLKVTKLILKALHITTTHKPLKPEQIQKSLLELPVKWKRVSMIDTTKNLLSFLLTVSISTL